jgi:hypothetical protein
MEQRAAADTLSPMRVARLQQIWNACVCRGAASPLDALTDAPDSATRLEIGMWDEALDPRLRREIVDAEQ